MASRNIFTNMFRASYPHLSAPYAHKPTQAAKYGLSMMFPKSGTIPADIGSASSDVSNIMQALNEVCMEEWGVDFANAPTVRGIQYPPEWKDGDQDWVKDDNDNKVVGTAKEASKGNWILAAKSHEPVGTVDHTGTTDIDPSAIYAGCWCRAELEVSAYTNKEKTSIIVVTLLNVQKCYDGENLGGGTTKRAATAAFAGMAVTDSNIQVGADQAGFSAPVSPAGAPTAPTAPALPQTPAAPVQAVTYTMTEKAAGNTREQLLAGGQWTDELMIQHGLMVKNEPAAPAAPAAPVMPAMPAAPTAPVMPAGNAYLQPPVLPS